MICLLVYMLVMLAIAFALKRKPIGLQILIEGITLLISMIAASILLYQNPFTKPKTFSTALIFLAIPVLGLGEEVYIPIDKLFVISAAALLPAAEEILFRWCLLKEFGVLVSALIFSLIHLTNVFSKMEKFSVEVLYARFLLGAVLGEIAQQSGSIIPPIIFHSAINLFAIIKSK